MFSGRRERGQYSLKTFGMLIFGPVIVLTVLCGLAMVWTGRSIDAQTEVLTRDTVQKILFEQRNAINMDNLRHSIQAFAESHNPKHAREAYINAWALLSESLLDRREDVKPAVLKLQQQILAVRPLRRRLDADVINVYERWHGLFSRSRTLTYLADADETGLEQLEVDRLTLFAEPGEKLLKPLSALRHIAEEACSRPLGPELKAKTEAVCERVGREHAELVEAVKALDASKQAFAAKVAEMKETQERLNRALVQIENSGLLEEVKAVTDITDRYKLLNLLPLVTVLLMIGALAAAGRLVIYPIRRTVSDVRRFHRNGEIPTKGRPGIIRELNDLSDWMMIFCLLSRAEKEKSAAMEMRYSELQASSMLDPLTGAENRRAFEKFAEESGGLPPGTGFLMLDVDHFKRINDTRGHQFGDRVLEAAGRALRETLKGRGRLFRYGGEEFCVVLPGSGAEDVVMTAEQLMSAVRRISRENAESSRTYEAADPLTISIGMTCVQEADGLLPVEEAVRRSDAALYQAKTNGRNRAVYHLPGRREEAR